MTLPRGAAGTPEPVLSEVAAEAGEDAVAPAAQGDASAGAAWRVPSAAVVAARSLDAAIAGSILRLVAARGPDRSICPSEAAREVAAADGRAEWHPLMGNVRRIAGRLQAEGRVEILRKGRPAAADVRGVIRLREVRPGDSRAGDSRAGDSPADADAGPADAAGTG